MSTPYIFQPGEREIEAIKKMRAAAAAAAAASQTISMALIDLRDGLEVLRRTCVSEKEAQLVANRLDRIRELINQAEIQPFELRITRLTDEACKQLP